MKLAALFGSLPILWPLWASAAPPPAVPAHGTAQPTAARPVAVQPARIPFAPGDAHSGALIFYDEEDESGWLAPQLSNQVEIAVTGLIARAKVQQSFENESEEV